MSSNPYLAEVVLFSFAYAPRGWAQCNGQLLPINQNQALFALLGTTYGGNGQTTFALPDLRGRVALGSGEGAGLSNYALGQTGGVESLALTAANLPMHTHPVTGPLSATMRCASGAGLQSNPAGNFPAADGGATVNMYSDASPDAVNTRMLAIAGGTTAAAGSGQPHPNMQPSLAMTFCIALQGVFPPR